jgi:hypothetical protein
MNNNERPEDIEEDPDYDPHVGCFAWPECGLNPLGCIILMGDDVECFGHKD